MALYRIMMKPAAGYPAECWAECDKPEEIAPLIAEMRSQFGQNEPARVLHYEGFANEKETVFLVDDPAGMFTKDEAAGPHYEFDQQEHGAVMPEHVALGKGTCSQCGRKNEPVAKVHIIGMGQDVMAHPCRECLSDMAAGTQVFPLTLLVFNDRGNWSQVGWNDRAKKPVIAYKANKS